MKVPVEKFYFAFEDIDNKEQYFVKGFTDQLMTEEEAKKICRDYGVRIRIKVKPSDHYWGEKQ